MKLRLEPKDEYMHALEEAKNFNESMYFNVYDPQARLGGFFRIGNRANESYAEVTNCLYLPDGTVAFMFGRPTISNNDSFSAGGMRFDVVEPFKELKVGYKGKVVHLKKPLEMAEPRKAFKENPWLDCEVSLTYKGASPMYGGEPVSDDDTPLIETDHQEGFARGHYEQHVAGEGTIRVGEKSWNISGYGLRDHSWGPRYWQSPWWYRWLTANFGADFGFMVSIVTGKDGSQRVGGMILENGRYEMIRKASIASEWQGEAKYHQNILCRASTDKGEYEIRGKVLSLIPLRNRREGPGGEELVTRISEGLTEWSCRGRTGYGLSEYLDQIVGGAPVGL